MKLPMIRSEPMLKYAVGSNERNLLKIALQQTKKECPEIPCIIGGKKITTGLIQQQRMPSLHSHAVCTFHRATPDLIRSAIDKALEAKRSQEKTKFVDRAAVFFKAADLVSKKYRYKLMAATMLGTGKNVWQAEIDAAAETADFLRFGPHFAKTVYEQQPMLDTDGVWNRLEHRALEGFVAAISPFNFCAIGINLPASPVLMGNSTVWKPASTSVLSNYLTYEIMHEAGLPEGLINFLPSTGKDFGNVVLSQHQLSGVHFTGSTQVFETIWQEVAANIRNFRSFPRLVGETGGKNYHFVHESADVESVVNNSLRAAFEYQGQKCSACSRLYIPEKLWPTVRDKLAQQIKQIRMGQPDEFDSFMTAVIDQRSFDNARSYIEEARHSSECEIIVGGRCDDSKGYFIEPTLIKTTNPHNKLLQEEIFAPILTVYVYPNDSFIESLKLCSETSELGLTGSIFARDRRVIREAMDILRHSAGNFYVNDKCTGAVVGEQPFGGARKSGTNDKAGSAANYFRQVSSQTIKETSVGLQDWRYPHMEMAD